MASWRVLDMQLLVWKTDRPVCNLVTSDKSLARRTASALLRQILWAHSEQHAKAQSWIFVSLSYPVPHVGELDEGPFFMGCFKSVYRAAW